MQVGQYFTPYRIFRGYLVPECLLPYQGISTGAKLCLAVMHRYIGKNEQGWPGQETIAAKMGVSLRTLQGYIAELEKDGFLESIQRGLGKPNLYKAKWHPIYDEDDGTTAGLDPQDSAGLDAQEVAGLDTQNSAGLIEEEEGHLKEGQSEEDSSFESISQHEAIDALTKQLGRNLTKQEKTLVKAGHPYPCGPDGILAHAKRSGWLNQNGSRWPQREQGEAPPRQVRRDYQPRAAEAPSVAVALPLCATIPEFLTQCANRHFSELFAVYAACGMGPKITLSVLEEFWPTFRSAPDEHQVGAVANARITFPKSREFTKMPAAWWKTKPWTATTFVPEPVSQRPLTRSEIANAEARRILGIA